MATFGCIKSDLLGNEPVADNFVTQLLVPDFYELDGLEPVHDQGFQPICCSVSLYDMVAWHLNFEHTKLKESLSYFYDKDPMASAAGMQPKRGLEIAIGEPIMNHKFSQYAKINTLECMKKCIMMYGPVMVALPAYSDYEQFWKGYALQGGHAVVFVGFDNNSFKLKNSWGSQWADMGYTRFPFEDFNLIQEAWTLIR